MRTTTLAPRPEPDARWGRVPAAPAVRHLSLLFEAGMTWVEVRERTGVGHATLIALRKPGAEYGAVMPETRARILGTPIPPRDKRVPSIVHADGTGTRRRLQALHRIDWSSPALAEHLPFGAAHVSRLTCCTRVTLRNRNLVITLFELLRDVHGPSRKAGLLAASRGWFPPDAWDGRDIDDPAAKPVRRAASTTAPEDAR